MAYNYTITAEGLPQYTARFATLSPVPLSAGESIIFATDVIPLHKQVNAFVVDVHVEDDATYKEEFRWSTDNSTWSGWLDLSDASSTQSLNYTELSTAYIQYRLTVNVGGGTVRVDGLEITGERSIDVADGPVTLAPGESTIFKPTDIYKIFYLSGVEITQEGADDSNPLELSYRYSYTSGKTWSMWEPLTNENISTARITPLRHVMFEVSATNAGSSDITITEIELVGRYQNITKAYNTSARLGIRASCESQGGSGGESCCTACGGAGGAYNPCPSCGEVAKATFNPYAAGGLSSFYEYVNSSVAAMWGHEIDYYKVNPDESGIDEVMHEYQLHNGDFKPTKLKVIVPQNQFPDNQIKFNEFNLDLFETFEVHITKPDFRSAFGIEYRPNKKDVLFFCAQNRLYEVEHVMHDRGAFSTSTYYRVVLKKFTKDTSVKWTDADAASAIDMLTQDGTLDSLLSTPTNNQTTDITHPEQRKDQVKSYKVRKYIGKSVKILNEDVLNASLLVATGKYRIDKFRTLATKNNSRVGYGELDNTLTTGESRGVSMWFKLSGFNAGHEYVFLDNLNDNSSLGYRLSMTNDVLTFNVNGTGYSVDLEADNNIWYCLYAAIDGRNNKVELAVYTRMSNENPESLPDATLKLLANEVWAVDPVVFSKTGEANMYGPEVSNTMKAHVDITNVRLYRAAFAPEFRNRTLNSLIVKEESLLMFRDNAEPSLDLPVYGVI